MTRIDDLVRFYDALGRLEKGMGGFRKLTQCNGRTGWPARGVYFFFEPGEERSDSGIGPRVTRVGTHALTSSSQSSLWGRLSQHRGQIKNGAGNHRGSIFRLLVGEAMKNREGMEDPISWGNGSSAGEAAEHFGQSRDEVKASELALEVRVSEYIGGLQFLWLGINDPPGSDSLRGYVERNAIALLSNIKKPLLDGASAGWLGLHSCRPRVRQSGLWNNKHVDELYDPAFLDRLDQLVAQSLA